jgi:hypothetical protein
MCQVLKTKSMVVHFQGKAFNPGCLGISLQMLGEAQLIRELRGINHRVKTVHVLKAPQRPSSHKGRGYYLNTASKT